MHTPIGGFVILYVDLLYCRCGEPNLGTPQNLIHCLSDPTAWFRFCFGCYLVAIRRYSPLFVVILPKNTNFYEFCEKDARFQKWGVIFANSAKTMTFPMGGICRFPKEFTTFPRKTSKFTKFLRNTHTHTKSLKVQEKNIFSEKGCIFWRILRKRSTFPKGRICQPHSRHICHI